jgi:transcriptional regulator with XRE-family HTH domain
MLQTSVYLDGKRLKHLRVTQGITVRALASRAGTSTSTITLLERNERNERFQAPTLTKLAQALEVEPTELLGEE